MAGSLGARFVEALAAKDHARLSSLLHPEVDFRGMTPGRFWEASTATQVVDEVLRVDTGRVGDRERVGHRLAVSNPDGRFLVEQQAYYETSDGQITWMRAMCSGFRPMADG